MKKHYKKYSKIVIILLALFFIYLAFRVLIGLYYIKKDLNYLNSNLNTNNNTKEGYSNYNLDSLNPGKYPLSQDKPLLNKDYPLTGRKTVSNKSYNDIWWEYPIFKEGSYKQITNNLRYYDNPDEGTCIRAEFCNTLYKNKKVKSNYILPLPPVSAPNKKNGESARVNYYWAQPDILLQPTPDIVLQPKYK
jgi:hypothetical protein